MKIPRLLAADVCAQWLALIDRRYEEVDRDRADPDFLVHGSSLRLRAVPGLPIGRVLHHLSDSLRRAVGPLTACGVDHCWVRRQYPPCDAPAGHAPHSWHQDGALNFDFAALDGVPPPDDALLRMLTCWITLTPCGADAPGLEIVDRPIERLLPPNELTAEHVASKYGKDLFLRPMLEAGDALLLRGDSLHRTYVSAGMTISRTSIELRLFDPHALPARLFGDRFLPIEARFPP